MISVVVFVYWPEEEELIDACLVTVSWADEIIVIDNGATKKTLETVRKFTKQIHHSPSSDFAARHNLGQELAKGEWILYLDADERLSRELVEEIKTAVENPEIAAYELRRVNYYLGKKVRFGDRYPDYVTRLFRKTALSGWSGEIHESSLVEGQIAKLSAPFYHLTHRDIFTMMKKTINFADHEAHLRLLAGHPPVTWWRLPRVIVSEAVTRLVRFQGVRQGTEGWIDGLFQAFSLFIAYVRLWELQRVPPLSEIYRELDKKIAEEFRQ